MDFKEFLQSIDIVEYISQYVALEQKGGEWWGLSCFKNEKTPSFSVRENPPVWYDFSSGKSGTIVDFVKEYFHCTKTEAINKLKEYGNWESQLDNRSFQTTRICKRFAPKEKRKPKVEATALADDYMLRYDEDWDVLKLWIDEGISKEVMQKFQVRFDRFDNRIVYPIRNESGEILNIGGRTVDPDYKEKHIKKYIYYFKWGMINTIYGVFENYEAIKDQKEIILFEGCKSVLIAQSWGIENCGAILTSHLSFNQVKILIKLGCRVVFALDKDVNIFEDKNISRLKSYINVEYIWDKNNLLSEKDSPVDKGRRCFMTLYNQRRRF